LADKFLSFSRTGTGTVYTVPTANEGATPPIPPTTALVKSIRISNQTGGAVTTTVSMMDYSNSSLEIPLTQSSYADASETEVLTQPIALEQQDAIKITGAGITILVSLLEIT
tara:strand:- start:149 stop:484 length:336 start_codon:yes stop_codon:yes gene_type:complete